MVVESADPEYFVPPVDLTKAAEYTAESAQAGAAMEDTAIKPTAIMCRMVMTVLPNVFT
jgi:hypothetical protein